jgi:hypothetical protein
MQLSDVVHNGRWNKVCLSRASSNPPYVMTNKGLLAKC